MRHVGPEHPHLDVADLKAMAHAEAIRADLIGGEPPRITEEEFSLWLKIGVWRL